MLNIVFILIWLLIFPLNFLRRICIKRHLHSPIFIHTDCKTGKKNRCYTFCKKAARKRHAFSELSGSYFICLSGRLQQQEQDPTNLYMANLPPHFKENDVDQLLAKFGQVVSTRILRDTHGHSKGVGFARMESREKCEQIIQVPNCNQKLISAYKSLMVI